MAANSKLVEFTIGELFPPDDVVARWVTALAISHNDIRHCNVRLITEQLPANEAVYYFRLVASHFKEIAEDLDTAYSEWSEVRAFVDMLPDEARIDFRTVLEVARDLEADLGRLRNTMFHYPELDRRQAAKGREKLQAAMQEARHLPGRITVGERFGTVRMDYADEVVVQFVGDDELAKRVMSTLQEGVLGLWRFSHHAIDRYLDGHPGSYTIAEGPPLALDLGNDPQAPTS